MKKYLIMSLYYVGSGVTQCFIGKGDQNVRKFRLHSQCKCTPTGFVWIFYWLVLTYFASILIIKIDDYFDWVWLQQVKITQHFLLGY